jgi:hypothetical protein
MKASIEEVSWQDVRPQVKKVAYDLYQVIERLTLTKKHKLYRVRYPYGAMIIGKDGICNLPNKNGVLTPITDSAISNKMRENLNYSCNGIPMSLILSGEVELFFDNGNSTEIESDSTYQAGFMLATRAVLDNGRSYHPRRYWRMTSGIRTLFSLGSICDTASFNRLKKYFNLSIDKSMVKLDVWPLFAALANSEAFPNLWQTEHLFFGKEWLKKPVNDTWAAFRLVLFERAWKNTMYFRNVRPLNRIWNLFKYNKKMTDHTFYMLKYIIEASLNQAQLYKPIDQNDIAGPFKTFIDILLNIYGLKKYLPIIMRGDNFDFQKDSFGYISIQKPCIMLIKNQSMISNNLIFTAREIRKVLLDFIDEITKEIIKVNDTPFYNLRSINFDFYHSDKDIYKEFQPASEVFSDDPVVNALINKYPHKEIPFRNDLLRSCIKIYKKSRD